VPSSPLSGRFTVSLDRQKTVMQRSNLVFARQLLPIFSFCGLIESGAALSGAACHSVFAYDRTIVENISKSCRSLWLLSGCLFALSYQSNYKHFDRVKIVDRFFLEISRCVQLIYAA